MRKSKTLNSKGKTHRRKTQCEINLNSSIITINVNQLNSVKRQRLSHRNKHQLPKLPN